MEGGGKDTADLGAIRPAIVASLEAEVSSLQAERAVLLAQVAELHQADAIIKVRQRENNGIS